MSSVNPEEIKTVEGIAGAKTGLALASKMELLKARTAGIPIVLGGLAGVMLPGKKTDKKVEDIIKLVKESSMDKATFVFQKISKCKTHKKKKMNKKAGVQGAATAVLLLGGLAPKSRKTAISMADPKNPAKNLAMKKMINLPRGKKNG